MLETNPKRVRVQRSTDGGWVIQAPAKLNLGLRVFPARPDGFHDIETWMVPVSWHDTLTWRPGADRAGLALSIQGRTEGIPTDLASNLVGRAAVALGRQAGIEPHGALGLHKVLPPGGGMGGGSSDAANALVLLNEAWGCHLDEAALTGLAASLGSDVPFFVVGQAALCRGRGERMSALRPASALFAALLVPPTGLATKPVYQAFDAGHRHGRQAEIPWGQWAGLSAEDLNKVLVNDLEPPALAIAPWLAELRAAATAAAGRQFHMTGSGSTLFVLCGSAPEAAQMASRLESNLPDRTVCVPVRIL